MPLNKERKPNLSIYLSLFIYVYEPSYPPAMD